MGLVIRSFDAITPASLAELREVKVSCDVLVAGVLESGEQLELEGSPASQRAQLAAGLTLTDVVVIIPKQAVTALLAGCDASYAVGPAAVQLLDYLQNVSGGVAEGWIKDGVPFAPIILLPQRLVRQPQGRGNQRPAIFVDRDGTIVENVDCLKDSSEMRFIPGALEGLRMLRDAGFELVLITNQPGLGMGLVTRAEFVKLSREFLEQCWQAGAYISRIYYCDHTSLQTCECRKPAPALVERAVKELQLDLPHSYVVGDMSSDVMLGTRVGCRTVLVRTGFGGTDGRFDAMATHTANDLVAAASWIIADAHTANHTSQCTAF